MSGCLPTSVWPCQTTYWGSRPELAEVLDRGARGLLRSTVTTFPLEQALEAYHRMARGDLEGRAVVVPTTAEDRPTVGTERT